MQPVHIAAVDRLHCLGTAGNQHFGLLVAGPGLSCQLVHGRLYCGFNGGEQADPLRVLFDDLIKHRLVRFENQYMGGFSSDVHNRRVSRTGEQDSISSFLHGVVDQPHHPPFQARTESFCLLHLGEKSVVQQVPQSPPGKLFAKRDLDGVEGEGSGVDRGDEGPLERGCSRTLLRAFFLAGSVHTTNRSR